MRVRDWLFVVSVLLFVSGIGFIIAAERTRRSVEPASAAGSEVRAAPPVATVKQLMTGMIDPAARAVWESVSVVVSEAGTEEKQPRTDEEWGGVATNAAMLVESATLLMQGPRAVDTGDWARFARDMAETSTRALKAAEARKPEAILEVGEDIYKSCTGCHEQYLRN